MNKNFFIAIFLGIALLYIFNIDSYFYYKFTTVGNNLKDRYLDIFIKSGNFVTKYFDQANNIQTLQDENQELKKYKLLYEDLKVDSKYLYDVLSWQKYIYPELRLTKVISYKNPKDQTQIWIDFPLEKDKIVGLIFDNYAAGIAVNKNNKTLALLNNNEKSNYGVIIGEEKATGITHGGDEMGNILIKYIPLWQNFKIGDIVYTSGTDGIFYEGLKVGEIISIKEGVNTYEAYMKPYVVSTKKRFFYICELKKEEQELE
ncbi:MAG: rod shape-determining protein MreC [Arcobacter butzleri]|nr:rod shape-determining protein MreC [Aliarcobacter butzleri]